ncbi:uncharacterized protein LOC113847675 [Abrus precatorius]|uniref:Uncharacterized protein LOC113847675 n=1 Tax=Abrus precatorius TaxID=3816 RepID=A0A8B8JMM5_ABRPR|nr:uncharacterized protein LOC113847675 [Abrus precatorius]
MADWGGSLNKSSGFGGGSMSNEDFDEEDVWGVAKERERDYLSPKMRLSKESSGSSSAWRLSTSPRKIPRTNSNSITLPSLGSDTNVVQRSSAPMAIPDWSKIYGKNGKKGVEEGVNNKGDCGYEDHYYHDDEYGDDDVEDEDDMIPPHEWIARKLARSQISSFSVCEGIGRTLKGRDLSKVRNAILTKTGFIE